MAEQAEIRGRVWRKHGKSRVFLYLDGVEIGSVDPDHGDLRPGQDVPVQVVAAAALKWASATGTALPRFRWRGLPWPDATPDVKAHDLANNRAGAAVARQARSERGGVSKEALKWYGRSHGLSRDDEVWDAGARGERAAGKQLDALVDRGWRVLHSIPVGGRGSDIDHVLIGPAGVFTINTKYHPRRTLELSSEGLRLDGDPVDYLGKSLAEGQRAERLLSRATGVQVPVTPVLLLAAGLLVVPAQPRDLWIIHLDHVPAWPTTLPVVLSPETVDRLFGVARNRRTWQPSSTASKRR